MSDNQQQRPRKLPDWLRGRQQRSPRPAQPLGQPQAQLPSSPRQPLPAPTNQIELRPGELARRLPPLPPNTNPTVGNWKDKWQYWVDAGQGHDKIWLSDQDEHNHYIGIFQAHGYELGEPIQLMSGRHDHHIYRVRAPANKPNVPAGNYVCKIVSMGFYKDKHGDMEVSVQAFRKETDILLRMHHENIIAVLESFELLDRQTQFPYNYGVLVMETMDGTLHQYRLSLPNQILNENENRVWVRDVANALNYMHTKEKKYYNPNALTPGHTYTVENFTVVHMALTPRNILYKQIRDVYTNEFIRFQFKLADFEECYVYEKFQPVVLPEHAVENPYLHLQCATELAAPNTRMRTPPMDIFSLGACLDYMASGFNYFFRSVEFEIRVTQFRYSDGMARFIRGLTNIVPNLRPTAARVLEDPWLDTPELRGYNSVNR